MSRRNVVKVAILVALLLLCGCSYTVTRSYYVSTEQEVEATVKRLESEGERVIQTIEHDHGVFEIRYKSLRK